MALTLANVKELKDECKYIEEMCAHLLETRQREKLFDTADAIDVEINAARRFPSDYYYFRDYAVRIELRVDRSYRYYVVLDGKSEWIRTFNLFPYHLSKRNYFIVAMTDVAIQEYTSSTTDVESEEIERIRLDCFNEAVLKFNQTVEDYLMYKLHPDRLRF